MFIIYLNATYNTTDIKEKGVVVLNKEPKYTDEELKISTVKKVSPFSKLTESKEVEPEKPEEEVGAKDAIKVFLTIIFGYMMYALIPTFVLTKFVGLGFGFASLITFGIAVVLFFALGLYKPASAEQLAKRDMNRRRKRLK